MRWPVKRKAEEPPAAPEATPAECATLAKTLDSKRSRSDKSRSRSPRRRQLLAPEAKASGNLRPHTESSVSSAATNGRKTGSLLKRRRKDSTVEQDEDEEVAPVRKRPAAQIQNSDVQKKPAQAPTVNRPARAIEKDSEEAVEAEDAADDGEEEASASLRDELKAMKRFALQNMAVAMGVEDDDLEKADDADDTKEAIIQLILAMQARRARFGRKLPEAASGASAVLDASEKQASATPTSSISATSSPLPETVSPNAGKQVANVNREEDARRKAAEDAVQEANEAPIRWQDLTEPIRSAKEDANKKKAVAVFYDPRMEEHLDWHQDDRKKKKERCPEVPERISRIFQRLEADNLIKQCIQPQCRKATWEDLQLIHEKSYVREIRRTRRGNEEAGKIAKQYSKQYGTLQMCSHSYDAALLSAGVVLDAVRWTCEGVFDQAICVIRPPGHHAEEKAGMGFCIFGNVALAVATARKKGWAERVLIVDWDVHHGNGTQKAFETDETVLFFSIHRYDLFPCTEYGNYTSDGTGSGKGFSLNVPWGTTTATDSESMPGDTEYFQAFSRILLPVAREFKPDLVVVSAGFDAAVGDPLGKCHVSPAAFYRLTKQLLEFANGKLVLALEGGYNLESICDCMSACVSAILEKPGPSTSSQDRPIIPQHADTIEAVRKHFAPLWPCLQEVGGKPREE